jgi:hypothetical protein
VMWRLKGEQMYLAEALRMGDQLAALDPKGPTSFVNQDQATREIAMALAKGADVLAGDLDPVRKAAWLAAITVRTNEMYANLAGDNGRLDQFPFDSHGNTELIFLVLISSLTLGDIPDAQKWFDFSFRAYANSPSPWSGPEGGYANGTAYAEYTAGYLVSLWDPLSQATGINFYGKPWAIGFLDFATEFTPPGARTHVFGDGSETRPDTRVFHAFASRLWSPRAAWYAKNLGGTEDTLSLLQAPYPLPVASTTYLSPPSNSAFYPSIGWTAMHSDLGSPGRTSVFFKSSPYGSFSHSHGDQNAFLLSVAGQPLLIKAGWYDWYGSPYWLSWYHQTKSQNAITFDGGKGQMVDDHRLCRPADLRLRRGRCHAVIRRAIEHGQAPAVVPAHRERRADLRQARFGAAAQLRVQPACAHRDRGGRREQREDRHQRPVGVRAFAGRRRLVVAGWRRAQAGHHRRPRRVRPGQRRQVAGRIPGAARRRLQAAAGQYRHQRRRAHRDRGGAVGHAELINVAPRARCYTRRDDVLRHLAVAEDIFFSASPTGTRRDHAAGNLDPRP